MEKKVKHLTLPTTYALTCFIAYTLGFQWNNLLHNNSTILHHKCRLCHSQWTFISYATHKHHKFLLPSSKLLLHFPSNASLKSLMSFTPQPPMILRTTYLVPTHSNNFPPILLTTLKEIPLDGDQLMCDNMRSFKKNKRKRLIEKRGPRYWGISSQEMISAYVSTLSTSY